MKQRSAAFRFVPVLWTLTFLGMLVAPPAWGQGNSDAAHWCAANFPPGQRGQCVSQAAHGSGPFFTCGPGGTNVGLCGGVGGVCCAASEVCAANACATPTPTSTPTDTPTATPTPTPTLTNTPTTAPTLVVGSSFEGIDSNASNCNCVPPDTNAAVGNGFVVETVNLQIRIFDKTGNILFDESLASFFASIGGVESDPYIVYDDIAGRWYVTGVNQADLSKLSLAISKDANPLDGFTYFAIGVGASGDLANFPKLGFNADAIVLVASAFGDGHTVVTAIDKSAALSGSLVLYQTIPVPGFQFVSFTPAQMHGAAPGQPMWFMSTDSLSFPASTIRVSKLTNVLSNAPNYAFTAVPVNTFGNTTPADQPGAPSSVATNDNPTTTQVDFRNGKLVTALNATDASDGFAKTHVHWYQVDISGGTPTLLREGMINPGPGVSTYFGTVAQDTNGNLGFTWMESSLSEFVSMWVGSLDTRGNFTAYDAAPGQGNMPDSFREGDYSSVVLDPTDGTTFWAANEYIGPDGSNDFWNTHITAFSSPP